MIIESLGLCYHLGCFKVSAGRRPLTPPPGGTPPTPLVPDSSKLLLSFTSDPVDVQVLISFTA